MKERCKSRTGQKALNGFEVAQSNAGETGVNIGMMNVHF